MTLSTQLLRGLFSLPLLSLALAAPFLPVQSRDERPSPSPTAESRSLEPLPVLAPVCELPELPPRFLPLTQVPADLGRLGHLGHRADSRCRA